MTQPALTLLYDGSCPICAWEQKILMRRNRRGLLGFIDIQSPEFNPSDHGFNMEALMGRLHGLTADGRVLVGVETLIAAYRAVGWWWVYLPISLLPRPLANRAYGWFADHRYTLSRHVGHWFAPACDKDRCRR